MCRRVLFTGERTSRTVSSSEVAALTHETIQPTVGFIIKLQKSRRIPFNHAVKGGSLVVQRFPRLSDALFTRAQSTYFIESVQKSCLEEKKHTKVFRCFGDEVAVKGEYDATHGFVSDGDVEVGDRPWGRHGLKS